MREEFISLKYQSLRIEHYLEHVDSLEEFEKGFPKEMIFEENLVGNYLRDLLSKYNKAASAISEDAGYATSYVGDIVNRGKKAVSRDALIAFCLAIGTTYEEAQTLLKYAGHAPLYSRRYRDVVLWFGFQKHMDIYTVNGELMKRNLKPIRRSEA